jgi:signal transduction histidine kinase
MKALSAKIELRGEQGASVAIDDSSERKQLEAMFVEIADNERQRLSADLHDGLGQELTGISLMLRSLARRTSPMAIQISHELDEIIRLVNHAILCVRKSAFDISPMRLERGGLPSALECLAGRTRDNYEVDVRLRFIIRSPPRIGDFTATHLYLIAQEAIHNAVKHGHAHSVIVKLRSKRTRLYLSIVDDGVGIAGNSERGAGMGLRIMKYRAAMIGGILRIKRLPNGGTRLHVFVRNEPTK